MYIYTSGTQRMSLLQEVAPLRHSKLSNVTICIIHNYSTEIASQPGNTFIKSAQKNPPKYPHETAL